MAYLSWRDLLDDEDAPSPDEPAPPAAVTDTVTPAASSFQPPPPEMPVTPVTPVTPPNPPPELADLLLRRRTLEKKMAGIFGGADPDETPERERKQFPMIAHTPESRILDRAMNRRDTERHLATQEALARAAAEKAEQERDEERRRRGLSTKASRRREAQAERLRAADKARAEHQAALIANRWAHLKTEESKLKFGALREERTRMDVLRSERLALSDKKHRESQETREKDMGIAAAGARPQPKPKATPKWEMDPEPAPGKQSEPKPDSEPKSKPKPLALARAKAETALKDAVRARTAPKAPPRKTGRPGRIDLASLPSKEKLLALGKEKAKEKAKDTWAEQREKRLEPKLRPLRDAWADSQKKMDAAFEPPKSSGGEDSEDAREQAEDMAEARKEMKGDLDEVNPMKNRDALQEKAKALAAKAKEATRKEALAAEAKGLAAKARALAARVAARKDEARRTRKRNTED